MKSNSLCKTIQNDILTDITEKQLKAGDKIPTEYELMDKYKVSRITASTALSELAAQNIIVRYPRRGSFVNDNIDMLISQIETNMPSQKTETESLTDQKKIFIGFIIPTIRDLFALNIIHGLSSCFYEDPNFHLSITYSSGQSNEEYVINDMIEKNTDGILLFPVDQEIYNEKILEMKVKRYPFVLVDRYLPGIESHYVVSDNVYGGQLATAHLCDLNHTNILVCCGVELETFSVKERVQGYRNELTSRGIPVLEENIISGMLPRIQKGRTKKQIEEMLLDPAYTGIITTDSATALFLYDFYKHHNIRIPEDKSIVSYDAPVANIYDFNPFTFIDQNEFTLGREAGNIMRNLLLNKNTNSSFTQKIITPKLVVNRTTGLAKK